MLLECVSRPSNRILERDIWAGSAARCHRGVGQRSERDDEILNTVQTCRDSSAIGSPLAVASLKFKSHGERLTSRAVRIAVSGFRGCVGGALLFGDATRAGPRVVTDTLF